MTVIPVLKQKKAQASRGYQVDQDLHDGIALTNAAYDTVVDRVYDIRGFADISAVFRAPNLTFDFSILYSSKDFDDISELVLADFEEAAEDVNDVPLTDIVVPAAGVGPNRLNKLVLTSDRKAVLVRMRTPSATTVEGDITLTR